MTQIGYHGIYYQYYHLNNDTWYLIRALFSMVGYRLFLRSSNKREVHSFLGKRTFLSEYNHFVIFLRRYQLYQVMSNLWVEYYQDAHALLTTYFEGLFELVGTYTIQHELATFPDKFATESLAFLLENTINSITNTYTQLVYLMSHPLFYNIAVTCVIITQTLLCSYVQILFNKY